MSPTPQVQTDHRTATLGRVFRLTYSNARSDDDPKLFQDRDAVAFLELNAALARLGLEFGTTLHLYPEDERRLDQFPPFRPSDVIVLTTRPPLHDQVGLVPQHRKIIRAAKTAIERALFAELAVYIEYCTRKRVILTKKSVDQCLCVPGKEKWEHVEFFEYGPGQIKSLHMGPEPIKPPPDSHSTVAFFLRKDNVPGLGCNFITSFGMDGYGTLIWNRIIRQRFTDWLAGPRFVMAEMIYKKPIPPRPLSPDFADDPNAIEVRLLT